MEIQIESAGPQPLRGLIGRGRWGRTEFPLWHSGVPRHAHHQVRAAAQCKGIYSFSFYIATLKRRSLSNFNEILRIFDQK